MNRARALLVVSLALAPGCVDSEPNTGWDLRGKSFHMIELSGRVVGDGAREASWCSMPVFAEAAIDPGSRAIEIRNMDRVGGVGTARIVFWSHVEVDDPTVIACIKAPRATAYESSAIVATWGLQGVAAQWNVTIDGRAVRVDGQELAEGRDILRDVAFTVPDTYGSGPANFTGTLSLRNLGSWSWSDVRATNRMVADDAGWALWWAS